MKTNTISQAQRIVSILIALLLVLAVSITLSSCGEKAADTEADIPTTGTLSQNGEAGWAPTSANGEKINFNPGQGFTYDEVKSKEYTKSMEGTAGSDYYVAAGILDGKQVTLTSIYQNYTSENEKANLDSKKKDDVYTLFGIAKSQEVTLQGDVNAAGVLLGKYYVAKPLPDTPQTVVFSVLVYTQTGHAQITFQTTKGFDFNQAFVDKFIKTISVGGGAN